MLCGLCRGKDQCLLPPGLHRADDAAPGEVDDKIDDAGRTEQHHHVRNVHGSKAVVGACGAQCGADGGIRLYSSTSIARGFLYEKKQSVPDGERPVVHIAIVCGFWQGASAGRTLFFYYDSSFSTRSIRYPTPTWVWIRCGASGHRSNFLRRDAM